jgi:hypothetical protein
VHERQGIHKGQSGEALAHHGAHARRREVGGQPAKPQPLAEGVEVLAQQLADQDQVLLRALSGVTSVC